MASVVVAAVSTLLGFGLLALSNNPALEAIGVTTSVGILASAILAPTTFVLTDRGA
jgi:predicted exporter